MTCFKFYQCIVVASIVSFFPVGVAQEVLQQPSRIEPIESQRKFFTTTWLGFGLYDDHPIMSSYSRYRSDKIGAVFTFDQLVNESWSGGIWIHWAQWRGDVGKMQEAEAEQELGHLNVKGPASVISPLTIISNVSYHAPLAKISPSVGRIVRPFLGAGFGWLQFLQERNLKATKSKQESSEPVFSMDFGIDLIVSESIGLRFMLERWRGINTYNFVGNRVTLQLLMGDFGEANGI